MYHCPFCENFTYDWNDTDSLKTKENTIKLLNEHINLVHPDELKPVSSRDPADNIAYIIPVLLPEASEPPTVSEVIV